MTKTLDRNAARPSYLQFRANSPNDSIGLCFPQCHITLYLNFDHRPAKHYIYMVGCGCCATLTSLCQKLIPLNLYSHIELTHTAYIMCVRSERQTRHQCKCNMNIVGKLNFLFTFICMGWWQRLSFFCENFSFFTFFICFFYCIEFS